MHIYQLVIFLIIHTSLPWFLWRTIDQAFAKLYILPEHVHNYDSSNNLNDTKYINLG